MVEEKGIRASLSFNIDEEAIRRTADEFTDMMKKATDGKFGIPTAQPSDDAGEGDGFPMGGPAGVSTDVLEAIYSFFDEQNSIIMACTEVLEASIGGGFDREGGIQSRTIDDIKNANKGVNSRKKNDEGGEKEGGIASLLDVAMNSYAELMKISVVASGAYMAIKAIMDAPMMKMFFAQFTQAFNLLFMPLGNALGMWLLPMSQALIETAAKFNKWTGEGGLVYGLKMLLREFLIWLGEIIVFDVLVPLTEFLKGCWDKAGDVWRDMIKTTKDAIDNMVNTIIGWWDGFWGYIGEKWDGLMVWWEEMKTTMKESLGSIISWVKGTYNWFKDGASELVGGIKTAFFDVIEWIWSKISDAMGWVTDPLGEASDAVTGAWDGAVDDTANWLSDVGIISSGSTGTKGVEVSSRNNNINIDLRGSMVSGINDLDTAINNAINNAISTIPGFR